MKQFVCTNLITYCVDGQNWRRFANFKNALLTLDSGIDVGQEITVRPRKFDKKNKCGA